ncbi:hypothetical protein V499_05007 [Pseudogymnoascus sp. VKM F-103]|nr:hypothetical protein V499_05007 [Pseudogymnoascus sp. VKM F-103]
MSRSQLLSRNHKIVIDFLPLTRTKEMLRLQQWITEETRRAHHGDERFRCHGGIRLSRNLGIVDQQDWREDAREAGPVFAVITVRPVEEEGGEGEVFCRLASAKGQIVKRW